MYIKFFIFLIKNETDKNFKYVKMTRRFNELKFKSLNDECDEAIQAYNNMFKKSPFYNEYQLVLIMNHKIETNYEKIIVHRLPTKTEENEYHVSCVHVDQLLKQIHDSLPEYELREQAIKNRLDYLIKIGS